MKNVYELALDEIAECIDGSTDAEMVKKIISTLTLQEGYIDAEQFADKFAEEIKGYIDAEVDSEEWNESYQNNWDWGYDLADDINNYLDQE
jgi:arginine/ornithine N-succinyltransferase beta subunit